MTSYSPFGNYTDVSKLMFSAKAEMEVARQTEILRKRDRLWNTTRHISAFRPVHKGHRLQSKSVVPDSSHRHRIMTYASGSRPILPQRYMNSGHECEHLDRSSYQTVLEQRNRDIDHGCEHFGRSSYWLAPEPEHINSRQLSDNRSLFQSFDPRNDVSSQTNAFDDLLECLKACDITDEPILGSVDGSEPMIGDDIGQEERLSASSFGTAFHQTEPRSEDHDGATYTCSPSDFGTSFPLPKPRCTDDFDREEFLSSAADLDSDIHRYDSGGAMSSASMSGLVERYVEQVVEQKMRERSAKSQTICVFCRRNGETREYYSTHVLKDTRGKVICPVLQKYVCPRCRATGDQAHTLRHCPLSENQASTADTFNTPRMSNGFRKF